MFIRNGTTTYVNLATLSNSANFAPHGGVLSMTLGNGLVQSQTFNSLLQPTPPSRRAACSRSGSASRRA